MNTTRRTFLRTGLLATVGVTLWRPGPLTLYRDQPQCIHQGGVVLALLDRYRNEACAPGYARLHTRPEDWASQQEYSQIKIWNSRVLSFRPAQADWGLLAWVRIYKSDMLQHIDIAWPCPEYVRAGIQVAFYVNDIKLAYVSTDCSAFSQSIGQLIGWL